MKKRHFFSLLTFFLATLLALLTETGSLPESFLVGKPTVMVTPKNGLIQGDATASALLYPVAKVVDGDTISVSINDEKKTIRLIGINTPETVDPRKEVECFGKEASDKVKQLLIGQHVRLESDETQANMDRYGRLLKYVYLSDGLLLNKYLIEEGYAYEYTYDIPYKYQDSFKKAQVDAKTLKKGLWGEVCQKG